MDEADFKFVLNRVARSKALPNSTFWSSAYAEDVTMLVDYIGQARVALLHQVYEEGSRGMWKASTINLIAEALGIPLTDVGHPAGRRVAK